MDAIMGVIFLMIAAAALVSLIWLPTSNSALKAGKLASAASFYLVGKMGLLILSGAEADAIHWSTPLLAFVTGAVTLYAWKKSVVLIKNYLIWATGTGFSLLQVAVMVPASIVGVVLHWK